MCPPSRHGSSSTPRSGRRCRSGTLGPSPPARSDDQSDVFAVDFAALRVRRGGLAARPTPGRRDQRREPARLRPDPGQGVPGGQHLSPRAPDTRKQRRCADHAGALPRGDQVEGAAPARRVRRGGRAGPADDRAEFPPLLRRDAPRPVAPGRAVCRLRRRSRRIARGPVLRRRRVRPAPTDGFG